MSFVARVIIFFSVFSVFSVFGEDQAATHCLPDTKELQQTISSYLSLARSAPEGMNSEFNKNIENHEYLSTLHREMNNFIKINNELALSIIFNNEIYPLQGMQSNQNAVVTVNKDSLSGEPNSSVFIINDAKNYKNSVLLILSTWGPVSLKVIKIDRCFKINKLFDSSNFPIYKLSDGLHGDLKIIKKVTIDSKHSIFLYENNSNQPLVLHELIKAYNESQLNLH